jgi:hypothetical protein
LFTSPRRKMRLMTLIKLVKLFVLWSESDPLLYQWCQMNGTVKSNRLQNSFKIKDNNVCTDHRNIEILELRPSNRLPVSYYI